MAAPTKTARLPEVELEFFEAGYFAIHRVLGDARVGTFYLSAKRAQKMAEWIEKINKTNTKSVDPKKMKIGWQRRKR